MCVCMCASVCVQVCVCKCVCVWCACATGGQSEHTLTVACSENVIQHDVEVASEVKRKVVAMEKCEQLMIIPAGLHKHYTY